MKKSGLLSLLIILSFSLVSCGENKIRIISPNGTPALGLVNFYQENQDTYSAFDIVSGADPLQSAFASEDYEIIIAPTNLGAKFYNETQKYVLYQTFVWGNLFIASTENIDSFEALNGKSVTLFGKNSTPDIIMKSLIQHYDLNIELNYVDDVETANSLLLNGEAPIIVSAQPSLTKILSANKNIYALDLQEEFKKISNHGSYPQASIFVKNSMKEELKDTLKKMTDSVKKTNENPSLTADNAVLTYTTFSKLGKTTIEQAIPQCHFEIVENQKEAIEYYFNAMLELGFGKQIGGKLPDENFYF